MERVRLLATGWDRDLAYEEDAGPPPAPEADQVLVAIEACGVCHRDLLDRAGRFPFLNLPVTPGHEAVGRVVAVGSGVTTWKVGDRVATMHRDACGQCPRCVAGETSFCTGAAWVLGILADGGYASHLRVPESALYAMPDDLPAGAAATLHCTFGTAYRDLVTLGHLSRGERVLVTGANGGVGAAGVQIAARLGAHVVASVRNAAPEAFVRGLGAQEVVAAPPEELHRRVAGEVDLALDTVGVATFNGALRTLRLGGRMVIVGNIEDARAQLNLGYVITKGLSIIGGSGATRRDMAALLALHAQAPFAAPIHGSFPLSRADEAQRVVRAGGLRGRVILEPHGPA